jgi:DNA modification methylase
MSFDIHQSECVAFMRTLPDNSIDAIVTDPPYGLAFMGKKWDYDVPSEDVWKECLRVLKPGGHLLAFAGTRTQHRMAVRIEDAGFEIRDMIAWVYGSGFPKSLDVSKAIDKANGRKFEDRYPLAEHIRSQRKAKGFTVEEVNSWFGYSTACQHWESRHIGGARVPSRADYAILKNRLGLSDEFDELVARIEAEREVVGPTRKGAQNESTGKYGAWRDGITPTAPATPAAKQWQGWGTALKPALEPITVARKPFTGTVAANVLEHGTGAINVDGCRVGTEPPAPRNAPKKIIRGVNFHAVAEAEREMSHFNPTQGRFPANLIHDGSEEVVLGMGESSRYFYCAKASKRDRDEGCEGLPTIRVKMNNGNDAAGDPVSDRFTKMARNHHPTVKPTDLMRYLCRLVTPPGGTVLDPFMGSGSTGKAAVLEGFNFIGCDMTAEYVDIARARITHAFNSQPNKLDL